MADRSALWHPFTQHALAAPAMNIARAEGAYLYTHDGRVILDAISSWWVNTHGHGHPHIVKAIQNQAAVLEQVIFAGFTHEPAETLAKKLLAIAPKRFAHVFYQRILAAGNAAQPAFNFLGNIHVMGQPLAISHWPLARILAAFVSSNI